MRATFLDIHFIRGVWVRRIFWLNSSAANLCQRFASGSASKPLFSRYIATKTCLLMRTHFLLLKANQFRWSRSRIVVVKSFPVLSCCALVFSNSLSPKTVCEPRTDCLCARLHYSIAYSWIHYWNNQFLSSGFVCRLIIWCIARRTNTFVSHTHDMPDMCGTP